MRPSAIRFADRRWHAEAALASNPRSKALIRMEELIDRFGLDFRHPHVPRSRYQLFTATAAVLEQAKLRSSKRAVLIAHEFVTPLTDPAKRERNAADLDHFLSHRVRFRRTTHPRRPCRPFSNRIRAEPVRRQGAYRGLE